MSRFSGINEKAQWQTEYNYRAKIRLPDLTGVRQCKENNGPALPKREYTQWILKF